MNKIFKTKYNYLTKNSVVTSELAKNRGKSGLVKTALAIAALSTSHLAAAEVVYSDQIRGDLHKNADGTLIYSKGEEMHTYYHLEKLAITAVNPNTTALALDLDTIGLTYFGTSIYTGNLALPVASYGFRLILEKDSSIKATGENSTAIKVLDEFRKDRHDPAFLALSDEEKAKKIKELYQKLYTHIRILNYGTISSENGDAIDFSAFNRKDLFGKVVENLNIDYPVSVNAMIRGVISAPEDKAAFIGSDHLDNLDLRGGSKIEGNIYLGKGDDELYLSGSDISKVKVLEGSYKNNPDALDNTENNSLELRQELTGSSESIGTYEDKAIRNFGKISIQERGILNLTGNMTSNSGKVGHIKIYKGELNIAPKNTSSNIRLDYDILNGGIIDLSKNNLPSDTLTISGDYRERYSYGENTGELRVNTFWQNPDIQQTDKLIIEGNHKGTTTVKAYYQGNESIFGDVTRSDVEKNGGLLTPVVEIKGEEKGKFEGTAPTTNAGEAQLVRHGNKYYWTLTALEQPAPQPEPMQPVPQPEPEQPAPQPEPEQPAPQPEPVQPAPQPEPVQPAPQPEPVQPAPQPEPVQPAPQPEPEPVQPVPQPEPVQPVPQPEPVQPVPQPEPVQPAPQPEPVQPAPEPEPEPVQPVPQPAVPANNGPMIYAEQIAGYVQTQRIARETLLQENGKLQTRMGSLQAPLTPQT